MKKILLLIISLNLLFLSSLPANTSELLKIDLPSDELKAKRRLLINSEQVQIIIKEYLIESVAANIEFIDKNAKVLAKFGKIKKGKIIWNFKLIDKKFLQVKFNKENYATLLAKIKEKSIKPFYELALTNPKSNAIIKSYDIIFSEFAELTVNIKHPGSLSPGEELNQKITVSIENKGKAEAKDFTVDIVISSDFKIAYQPAVESNTFKDDMLLKNGRIKIESLKAGETKTLSFLDPVIIPVDLAPRQYYLGAIIDADNKIIEPDKENNIFSGFLMITVPAPKKITVDLSDAKLLFQPKGYAFKIVTQGITVSDGKEWRRCKMKANIYQFQHASWKDFHWEIDTMERSLWRVQGAKFCKSGGKAKRIKARIMVIGVSRNAPPHSVTIHLPKTQMEFIPQTRKFLITTFDARISHIQLWQTCSPVSHLYQFKHNYWKDYYWEINIMKNTLNQVTGKTLCRTGGTQKTLKLKVNIDK